MGTTKPSMTASNDYDPEHFTVDAAISLLDAVKDDTEDNPTELRSFAQDLRRIRQHCSYLAQQCDDRASELESDEADDDEDD